jgi:hypothetical protein
MPPRQIDKFDVYEFHVVIAEEKGQFIAVGYDKHRNEIDRLRSVNLDEVRAQIRHSLASKSDEFVGYEGAINSFLRAFPGGFEDPYFLYDERRYKQKAHEKASKLLSRDALSKQLAESDYQGIGRSARGVFINLIFPQEAMAFDSFLKNPKNAMQFAPVFFELLHGVDFDGSFNELSSIMSSEGAAKWTILTYWPFILYPDRHMFMKPEVAQECARRLGEDFGYESRPRSSVYRRFLGFVDQLRSRIICLKPRDNIDVQTFMYAVGKSGFVREGVDRRAQWMARQSKRHLT